MADKNKKSDENGEIAFVGIANKKCKSCGGLVFVRKVKNNKFKDECAECGKDPDFKALLSAK